MKPIEIIATDLFEKVRSRFTNLQIGDESGSVTADPAAARFFDFDFAVEGNVLGRVSISINETGNLKIFYSQGIMENADSVTQTMWYDFLKEMRFFAKRRLLRFDTRDITKGNLDKTDFQYLAQNGNKDPNMNESAMYGSSKTSHRKVENTDLIIRHSEAIDPTKPGARSRKIKNLFIQNAEGERFKFPFAYLPGARAMQRHIANGGYPHDDAGKHIVQTCEEILKLSDFGRKVKHATLNDNAHGIIERAGQKLKKMRHHLECMSKQGYYESWKESFAPEGNMMELDAATMESYKDTFTVNKFDEALAEVFPLLHSIMQEAGEIDLDAIVSEGQDDEIEISEDDANEDLEFAAFESWATAVAENTIDQNVLLKLKQFLEQNPDQKLGADGTEAIEALQGVGIKSSALEDLIQAKVQMQDGANIPLKDIIGEWLAQDDPEAAQQLFPPQPSEMPAPVPAEAPVAEAVSPALQKAFDGWMNSEYAPMSDEYGDDNALMNRASNFLHGKVPKEQIDHFAEKLVGMAYGEEDMDESMKNTDIADKSYLKTAGKKPGVMSKAVDTAKQAGKWLAGKGGPGKEGPTYESSFMGPEDYQEWLKDAVHRVAHGKVADWTELYAELTSDLGFDENKAERIAQRVYGHEKLQNRVAPTSDLEKDIPSDSGEEDDDEFLSNLRGQARSGSIKPGVDTGGVDEEDSIEADPEDKLIEKTGSAREIAEIVLGFYDKEHGTWTKGETGVVTHVKRQFSDENGNGGEKEAALATQLIKHLNSKHESTQQFEDIKKLAGLTKL